MPRRSRTGVAPAGVRRQPGRARDGRDRAGGARTARRRICARAWRSCSRRAPKTSTRCARSTPGSASTPSCAPFFPDLPARMAAAHLVIARSGASTVAELVGHRPAGHPGAAAACAGPGPVRQCRRAGGGRRRDPHRAARLHPRPPGRGDRWLGRRPGAACRAWRRPPKPPAPSTPPSGWPIWC